MTDEPDIEIVLKKDDKELTRLKASMTIKEEEIHKIYRFDALLDINVYMPEGTLFINGVEICTHTFNKNMSKNDFLYFDLAIIKNEILYKTIDKFIEDALRKTNEEKSVPSQHAV